MLDYLSLRIRGEITPRCAVAWILSCSLCLAKTDWSETPGTELYIRSVEEIAEWISKKGGDKKDLCQLIFYNGLKEEAKDSVSQGSTWTASPDPE
jgi:hypothetical protein